MNLTVYGIPNCSTVKKARAWLEAQGLPYQFHDYKKMGVPADRLPQWVETLGWEKLINRQGTTWRKLAPAIQAGVVDATTAQALMLVHASVIKRPLLERDGVPLAIGFDEPAWQAVVIG